MRRARLIRRKLIPGIIAALAALSVSAQTIPPDRARNLAAGCTGCHRGDGVLPALAGRPKDVLVQRMREFRSGARPSTVMGQLAKGYSDAEIASIAAYFAARPAGDARP